MIRGLQFLEPIPHWSWLLLGRQDVKKNIKLILIRNQRDKSLQSQIVTATAELFMQRIALQGWAICCCFCSKDPAPRFQCWNQRFWVPAWTEWVLVIAKCVPCSPLWRADGLSVSHLQCPGAWEWDKNKAKANAKPLTNLQMLLLWLFFSMCPRSMLGDAGLLLPEIFYCFAFDEMQLLFLS